MKGHLTMLAVSYYYPPIGGGYTERIVGYLKYISRYGAEVFVLSAQDRIEGLPEDFATFSMLKDVIRVWRVGDPLSFSGGERRHKLGAKKVAIRGMKSLCQPDGMRLWARRAERKAEWIVEEYGVDVLLTTSFPYSSHVVGKHLKRKKKGGLFWIADFRDPMSTNYTSRGILPAALWRYYARNLEAEILGLADLSILNTPWNLREVVEAFDVPERRLACYPNGYDSEEISRWAGRQEEDGRFVLMYVGGLRGDWFEGPFYRALHRIKQRNSQLYGRIDVVFLGPERLEGHLARKLGVERDIHLEGFVTRDGLNRHFARASAFLLLLPESRDEIGWVPQKLYNYLRAGQPIIASVPEGQAASYIRSAEAGVIVRAGDSDALGDAIERMAEEMSKTGTVAHKRQSPEALELINGLDRKVLARKLVDRIQADVRRV